MRVVNWEETFNQRQFQAFRHPVKQDYQFEDKFKEILNFEKGVLSLKSAFNNFSEYSHSKYIIN